MTVSHPDASPNSANADATQWLEQIVQALPVGIRVSDQGGHHVYVNKAALAHGTLMGAAVRSAGASRLHERRMAPADRRAEVSGGRTVRTSHHAATIAGQRYDIAVSADATEQQNLEDDLFRRAYFDELTGLPNRILIEQNVQALIEGSDESTCFALAFIDIDNFKHINDYYGHDVGDRLLIQIATRISAAIRPTDMLARVGGDELLLLLAPLKSVAEMQDDVTRLLDQLKEPFFIGGHEILTSASIGISIFPSHGRDYAVLRANADNAMYRMKSGVKGSVKIFDPQIGHIATERMKLEQRLRLAVRDRRLCCAFQPKVDFRAETVTGLEVLLRWRDEEGVIQAPGDFVDLAVDLGLMDDITLQVLRETVLAIDTIDETFGPHTSISINIAAKQANDVTFMRAFADALERTGCPARFMVELTEEAFLAKTQFQNRVLPMLREIGTRVSIDDFGVGFSSLSALADITADELKVDRSFITAIHQRPRSQSILAAIESLAGALGMSVIVEGVETYEELAFLQAATRIRQAQGYYFSRPVLFEDVAGLRAQPTARQSEQPRQATANRGRRSRAS